jgi:hypothetical protein
VDGEVSEGYVKKTTGTGVAPRAPAVHDPT